MRSGGQDGHQGRLGVGLVVAGYSVRQVFNLVSSCLSKIKGPVFILIDLVPDCFFWGFWCVEHLRKGCKLVWGFFRADDRSDTLISLPAQGPAQIVDFWFSVYDR